MRGTLILATLLLAGAAASNGTPPSTVIRISLPRDVGSASGRLLLFAVRAAPDNADTSIVDLGAPGAQVAVAARDVATFGPDRSVTIDTGKIAFPTSFAMLPAGAYRMQAVLDVDGSYNYSGRGPGDLLSKVVTVDLPVATIPSMTLDHALPSEPDQFDVTGLPPRAAEQITSSRPHLHDERILLPTLSRFHGSTQAIRAWVLTPPGYDPNGSTTYPTVYTAGGFGATHRSDGQQLSKQWHMMETGEIPPMIWVALDFSTPRGTTEFADSACNGPWGAALVDDVIPSLEARYRMDKKPDGRFLTGHSSGGWFALWTMVQHPDLFGGSWPTSPDPVDFHDFLGVDLYRANANMYRDKTGTPRPLERRDGVVTETVEQAARLEAVLGHDGGQLRSFEWVFSPCRADGTPAPLFDRATGAVDPRVAAYWRNHYDVAHLIANGGRRLKPKLDGKLHLTVGSQDSYYLDGPVRHFEAALKRLGVGADITYVSGASHSMAEVYKRGDDRNALWKQMSTAMYAIARPKQPSRTGS